MTTPFATDGWAGFAGEDPGDPQFWDVRNHRVWLGDPAGAYGMIELPSIGVDGYAGTASQGEVVHGLSGGGTAVTRFDTQTRQWTITWPILVGRNYQVLQAFYRGLFGGELVYVAPEDTNRLTLAQSLCGNLNGVAEGWTPSSGSVAYDATLSPAATPSGVLRWTGATSGSRLVAASALAAGVPVPDPDFTAPYLPAMPVVGYAWVWTATGTTTGRCRLQGIGSDGSLVHTTNGPTVTLTTTPQLVAVLADPGYLAPADWLTLDVQCLSAGAPNILVSNALLDYRDDVPDWSLGTGVPRVQWTTTPGGTIGRHMTRDGWTMTLAESVPGAA
jgi:hypothetical protein